MKRYIQNKIRDFHLLFSSYKYLPQNIAIYFHSLEGMNKMFFLEMVNHFRSLGYIFVTPENFLIDNRNKILLTFDDNYYDWYASLQFFEQANIKCTFFINSIVIDLRKNKLVDAYYNRLNFHGNRIPLKSEQIFAIAKSGHCIGGHTHTHYNLTNISYDCATKDIKINKEILQDIIKSEIYYFSYPYGTRRHFNANLEAFCYEIGYKKIFTAISGRQYDSSLKHRTPWLLNMDLNYNLDNLKVNGVVFDNLTQRSAIG